MAIYSFVIKDVALTAAATKTLWQLLTPADARAKVIEFGISFDGAAAAAAIDVDLLRQTTAGTMTAGTEILWDPADGVASVQATHSASAEPTAGDILASWQVPPNGGVLVMQYPLGREPVVGLSGRMGLRAITPAGVSPAASAYVVWEQ